MAIALRDLGPAVTPAGALLPKPPWGAPCNGCGHCCRSEPCGLATEYIGAEAGPCPALQYEDGRTYCGLVRTPWNYIRGAEQTPAEVWAQFSVYQAYLLGLGRGCDSED